MSWNSLGGFNNTSPNELRDAAGITQFPADGKSFYQVMNGLLLQSGITASIPIGGTLAVPFPAPYETQVIGIFIQPVNAAASYGSVVPAGTDNTQFTIINGPVAGPFYWFAVGV